MESAIVFLSHRAAIRGGVFVFHIESCKCFCRIQDPICYSDGSSITKRGI